MLDEYNWLDKLGKFQVSDYGRIDLRNIPFLETCVTHIDMWFELKQWNLFHENSSFPLPKLNYMSLVSVTLALSW